MTNNPNQFLQGIINLANKGKNPQQYMQMLLQRNPQYNQMLTQLQNMAQGKPMNEFVLQLARQKGVDNNTLMQLSNIMGVRQ